MLQVGRVAPKVLGESADLVRNFLLSQQNPDGGFRDRDGQSDLYYTVFGMDALAVFHAEPDMRTAEQFLLKHEEGEGLDLVHLSCLCRCWGTLGNAQMPKGLRKALLTRLEAFKSLRRVGQQFRARTWHRLRFLSGLGRLSGPG